MPRAWPRRTGPGSPLVALHKTNGAVRAGRAQPFSIRRKFNSRDSTLVTSQDGGGNVIGPLLHTAASSRALCAAIIRRRLLTAWPPAPFSHRSDPIELLFHSEAPREAQGVAAYEKSANQLPPKHSNSASFFSRSRLHSVRCLQTRDVR